jgi:hypothetical protein
MIHFYRLQCSVKQIEENFTPIKTSADSYLILGRQFAKFLTAEIGIVCTYAMVGCTE